MLNITQMAKRLNVTERTLYNWINQDKIPAYYTTAGYRFDEEEIKEWLANHKVKPKKEEIS